MSLLHAILGELAQNDEHGYRLGRTISQRLGDRPVNMGQIHEALSQLDARPVFAGGSSSGCRLSLLLALHHAGDLCVSDLAFAVGMTDSAVSHALRLLRAHGMVTAHRAGRMVHYRVAGELTTRLLDVVSDEVVGDLRLHGRGEEHAV